MSKSKGKFNSLHIDRAGVEKSINQYLTNGFKKFSFDGPNLINQASHQYRYNITCDGKSLKLDCYYREDNKTTLRAVGNNTEVTIGIMEHIYENIPYKNVLKKSYSIKDFDKDSFDLIVEYLSEIEDVNKKEVVNNDIEVCYQFISSIGDKITLHYYNTTNTYVFQGTIMDLYNQINYFITEEEISSEKVIVDRESEVLDIKIDIKDVEELLKKFLPTSISFLDKKLKNIIIPSVIFYNKSINFGEEIDHSAYTFPVLRGLEGYMKQLFNNHGLYVESNENFGKYISYCKSSKRATFKDSSVISCHETRDAICRCYPHWYHHRHGVFHTDKHVATSRILSKEDACILVKNTLQLIESTYVAIDAKKKVAVSI